jgi:hypothetical protein
MRLLQNSGNATGTAIQIRGGANRNLDQLHTVFIDGTFDGGAATLEIAMEEAGPWFAVPGFSITTKAVMNVEFKAYWVRGVVAGGGGTVSIDMDML